MWLVIVAFALAGPLPAAAAEYRLRVAGLYEEAFYALLGSAGTYEGPVKGDSRLIEALDTGEAPAAVLLYDELEVARPSVARAFGASYVDGAARPGPEQAQRWSEVRWEGKPGEWSVWVIAPIRTNDTRVWDVALKGTAEVVRVIPHRFALSQPLTKAVGIPLEFVQAYEGNPALWKRHFSPILDLSDGVAVVVGLNSGPFADHVFIVTKHAASPTTYNVVLAWKRRPREVEVGGDDDGEIRR
ncbi:MAG: hypothetical protein ACE5JI_21080 [Acidobacteriota bacterium]